MEVTTERDGSTLKAFVDGRLDSTTADDFMNAIKPLIDEQVSDLAIDMGQVDFISSKGVRMLVLLFKQMGQGHICLQNANASIHEVLRMSNLSKQFGLE